MDSTTAPAIATASTYAESTREPGPVHRAIDFTADRLDRLEHVLGTLTDRLEPVLEPDGPSVVGEDVAGIGTRSQVGDRVAGFGLRADRLAENVVQLTARLEV